MELPWQRPLMQAPIGPAGTAELVAAVSRTGALGTLAASWTEPTDLAAQVRALAPPFCVNLVLAFEQRDRLRAALDAGAPFVSFSWGIDPELIGLVHQAGAAALVQVGDARSARDAVEAGADVVIAQGIEAGGHVQSSTPLLELVPDVRAAVHVPVVAAGGIGTAEDARRARDAGADAVACGTVFLAAEEADIHPAYLDLLLRAQAGDAVLTTVFDGGWADAPHRVLRNTTLTRWERAGGPPPGRRPGEGDVIGRRGAATLRRYSEAMPTADTTGDAAEMALYAGMSAAAVTRREPAASIVERLLS